MPGNLLFADVSFPTVSGDDTKRDLKNVMNYLYMLREELRYTMGNIGVENFNAQSLTDLSGIVVGTLDIKIQSFEGSLSQIIGKADETEASLTLLSQYTTNNTNAIASVQTQANANSSSISLVVGSTKLVGTTGTVNASLIISTINGGTATIDAARINLVGYITATDLSSTGTTVIDGGRITTGTLSASKITTGTLNAANVSIINLAVDHLTSAAGTTITSAVFINSTSIYLRTMQFGDTNGIYMNMSYGVAIGMGSGSKIGFFGTAPAYKDNVTVMSTSDTLPNTITKLNELISALRNYGLV